MHISSLKQAEEVLLEYVPAVKAFTGKNITIERIKPILNKLGNPQDDLKIIHIAGTSGKTSTSYFVSALLCQTNKKIGLAVSPHIDKVTERIQLNGAPISDELFCKYLGECIDLIADEPVQPSYFELLMALSFWIFKQEHVDYAVIETGMGGLHDASNIANRSDKVCIITDIGFDHMHILGDTLAKISQQKAGIIHKDNTVFMYKQSHDVMNSIRDRITLHPAELFLVDEHTTTDLQHLPEYQKRNFILANKAVDFVLKRDSIHTLNTTQLLAASHVYIPARMDTVIVKGKTLIMDGAHNGQKTDTFIRSFIQKHGNAKASVLLALKQGKEHTEVLTALLPITNHLILTTFNTSQDLPAVSMDPQKLASNATQHGFSSIDVVPDNSLAYQKLLQSADDILVITGSFYLIAQIRSKEHLQHAY